MKKILIIQTRVGMGDMCVFLPCIHEIAKNFLNSEIDLLTKKRTSSKDFLDQDKYIHNIYYLPDEKGIKLNFSVLKILKDKKYENIFIMHYGLRYYLLSLLAGVKNIYFYGIFKKNESIVKKSRLAVSDWIGKTNLKFEPRIFLNKEYKKKLQITIGIGGSGHNKKWKVKNYKHLLNNILDRNSLSSIIVAGGLSEYDEANLLSDYIKEKFNIDIINLSKMSIANCLPYLAESKFYIGNDTGFMHLSACLNVPSFGIFGATPPDYSSYNKLIYTITPPGVEQVHYGDGMMNDITSKYAYKFLKDKNYVV